MHAGYPIDPNLEGSGGHPCFIAQDPWSMTYDSIGETQDRTETMFSTE